MSLTVHQFTRAEDIPASPPSLVEAGWNTVRHTFSRGWVTVAPLIELETFALGENLYTYTISPPRLPTKGSLNTHAPPLLKEWDQDLHKDDVYTLAELADFQSGLPILSDLAPASLSDNVRGLPLKYVPEGSRTPTRKPTPLPVPTCRDNMHPPDVSTPPPIPPTTLSDSSFVLGGQSPSASMIEVPHSAPHGGSTAHSDLAGPDIPMVAADEEEDALALLEHSEGLHLAGPASPHYVHDQNQDSLMVFNLILPALIPERSRVTIPGAAETACTADKEFADKGVAGPNADAASANKGTDTTDHIQNTSIPLASPPRFSPSALSPRAASDGPATTPLFVTTEHLSGARTAREGFYLEEGEEEDQIVEEEEEDELDDDDDDDDNMEVQLDVLESAQWEDFSDEEDIDEVGMDVELEESQEDELDELQDENFSDHDAQEQFDRGDDRIEEDDNASAEVYGDDDIVAGSQASVHANSTNAAVAIHIDSSERDELEDHDSIMQGDQSDWTPPSLAASAPEDEIEGESDVLSYITKLPSREEEFGRDPNASQHSVNEGQIDPSLRVALAIPLSEPAVHTPAIYADPGSHETPFTSLLDLLPRPHFHPVPFPPSLPITLTDLDPEAPEPESPGVDMDRTLVSEILSLSSIFSSPSHLPIAISPHTSSSALAHLQRPYARGAWIIPVRGALPWAGASSAVLVPHLPHINNEETPTTPATTITWTLASVRALWETLLSLRDNGTCGPLGLYFHAARRPKSLASNGSRPVTSNPDPRTALAKLDHIKIHVDTTHAAELRRALGEWAYEADTTPGQAEGSEWDFDEGAPIYVPSAEEENGVNDLGLHLDLEGVKDTEIDAGAAGAEVHAAEPRETTDQEGYIMPLKSAVLVLVDERNLGILLC